MVLCWGWTICVILFYTNCAVSVYQDRYWHGCVHVCVCVFSFMLYRGAHAEFLYQAGCPCPFYSLRLTGFHIRALWINLFVLREFASTKLSNKVHFTIDSQQLKTEVQIVHFTGGGAQNCVPSSTFCQPFTFAIKENMSQIRLFLQSHKVASIYYRVRSYIDLTDCHIIILCKCLMHAFFFFFYR